MQFDFSHHSILVSGGTSGIGAAIAAAFAEAGAEVVLAPELETPHHIAATTTEVRVRRAFYSGAAKQTFERKHGEDSAGRRVFGGGAWDRLVERTGRRANLAQLIEWAQRADRTLDRTPRWLAEKHVSWLVESAALSGELRPGQVANDV